MSGQLVLVLRILLTFALYLFLCLTLWLIWQELRQAGYQALRPHIPPLRLEVRAGRAQRYRRAFLQPEVTIGRDPICELRLDDTAVSARHARFRYHHAQWWIEDLGSTNGTSLNQHTITTATVLTDGDEIRCGEASILVRLDHAAAAAAPPTEEQHD